MKPSQEPTTQLQYRAFTLVEMLVVVAIIAILASILIPVVGRAKTKAKVAAARVEMTGLELAIKSYQKDYNRWPLPKNSVKNVGGDFTYGASGPNYVTPGNEALMEILMAVDNKKPDLTSRGFNSNHGRNPKKNKYIEPKESGEADGFPGLSQYDADSVYDPNYDPNLAKMSGRYHDPFGNEYFISLDLSGDGVCADAAYSTPSVSASAGGSLVGLVHYKKIKEQSPMDLYVYKGEVMIWSFGPDKAADGNPASEGLNKDNILSWR